MSKSKRVNPNVPPMPRRHILRNERGEVRPDWPLLCMVAGYFALTVAARLGLGALLRALFAAWNLNPGTLSRAPGWARALYAWQGSLVTLAVDAVAILFAVLICRARLHRPNRSLGKGWALGTLVALICAAAFLLADSLRAKWPLSRPRLSPGLLPLWALTLLTALAEELFTKGVIFDRVARRWGMLWAVAASTLAFFLTNGGYAGTWVSGINVALMGVLCALLYARHGLWAPAGFRWGWGFATVFLLGQGGGSHAVYRLYGVSEALLTGGDAGLVYGLGLTAILVLLIWLNRSALKQTRTCSSEE